MTFNLRHLRIFAAVVDAGSITQAAARVGLSQPAVTQAIARLEEQLSSELLKRTRQGVFPTEAGKTFAARTIRALGILDAAASVVGPRLSLTATAAQLTAFAALEGTGSSVAAAQSLGIAQPTLHRAAGAIQKEATVPLLERTSRGLVPTRSGAAFARAIRLTFAEMEQARMELADMQGHEVGVITIGALPLSRATCLPAAIAHFRVHRPRLELRIIDGPYGELLDGLLSGSIDFIVGALRDPPPSPGVNQTPLFSDDLVLVAGTDHPLTRRDAIDRADLLPYPFVVAAAGTPTRQHFRRLVALHSDWEAGVVESGSMIFMRELLRASHHLGCVSRLQAEAEVRIGSLAILPFSMNGTARSIGITTRKDWQPTRNQAELIALIGTARSDGCQLT